MSRFSFFLLLAFLCPVLLNAQTYSTANVFAHNDYVRPVPFHTAYDLGVGYIEADVFLRDGDLLVAHHKHEIVAGKNLETLYLEPLLKHVRKNEGLVYANAHDTLTLMIDLKTEGVATLKAIVNLLNRYPSLTSCRNLRFMISGSVPDPASWKDYPLYVSFDGRPGISYTPDQLERISMISTSFNSHVKWNGRGKLSGEDRSKIALLMNDAHNKGKKFRFWATPDFREAWEELMTLDMDVIVTDDVTGFVKFLKERN